MDYQNTLDFAAQLDEQDQLKDFQLQFLIPQHKGKDAIYFCGNSLGLQPKVAKQCINDQLNNLPH